jgi:hypothetical protein
MRGKFWIAIGKFFIAVHTQAQHEDTLNLADGARAHGFVFFPT